MLERYRIKDPNVMMLIGTIALLFANILHFATRWIDDRYGSATDATVGLFFGVAIGMLLLSVKLKAAAKRG